MPQEDLDYLQRRAESELEMAQQSESPEATAAHYQLAEAYLERIEAQKEPAKDEQGRRAKDPAGTTCAPAFSGGELPTPNEEEKQ